MKKKLKIADFFAGIGGMRLAFERAGFETVYANEINPAACAVYEANFGENPSGDITRISAAEIPEFDVFVGGFPCQPFSIAGKRKGLEDDRGNLFFSIVKILETKKPKAFLLENVKNLATHDRGNTLNFMLYFLNSLDYFVFTDVINAKDFGLPQKRERLFIAGFRKDLFSPAFDFPKGNDESKSISDILEKDVLPRYYLSQKMLSGLEKHRRRHKKEGNGFGYIILQPHDIANTVVAGNMGKERNLIVDEVSIIKASKGEKHEKNKRSVRYLTPREFARLQGFPDGFVLDSRNTIAYRLIANAVPIPVVEAIARSFKDKFRRELH